MKTLHSLVPAEVSLVSQPANRRKFLVLKFAKGEDSANKTADESSNGDSQTSLQAVLQGLIKLLEPLKSLMSKKNDKEDTAAATPSDSTTTDNKGMTSTPSAQDTKDSSNSDASTKTASDSPSTADDENDDDDNLDDEGADEDDDEDSPTDFKDPHLQTALDKAVLTFQDTLKSLGYESLPDGHLQLIRNNSDADENNDDEDDEDDDAMSEPKKQVTKSADSVDLSVIPEAVRPMVEMIYKQHQDLIAKNADLEKRIVDNAAKELKREVVQKASSYTHLGIPQEELVATLTDARQLSEAAYERITKQLDAVNAQIKKGNLFSEIGSSAQAASDGSALDKIKKHAQGYIAKSATPLSEEKAITMFLETPEGQALHSQYLAEMKGRA